MTLNRDQLPDADSFVSPAAYHKAVVQQYSQWEDLLWLLFYFCDLYHLELDVVYHPGKGYSYKIGSNVPTLNGKVVFFNQIGKMVRTAHRTIQALLDAHSGTKAG